VLFEPSSSVGLSRISVAHLPVRFGRNGLCQGEAKDGDRESAQRRRATESEARHVFVSTRRRSKVCDGS
jgi:hypothetical protein